MKRGSVLLVLTFLVLAAITLLGLRLWRGSGEPPPLPSTVRSSTPVAPIVPNPASTTSTDTPVPAMKSGSVSTPAIAPAPPPARVNSIEVTAPMPPSARANSPGLVATTPVMTPTRSQVDESAAATAQADQIGLMLRDYRTLMGTNPIGTNAEIMQALMGGNPKGARLGPPEGMSLNTQGELIDRWGTPIFFHQLSGTDMEIRSAGPDRVLWTLDDVTQH